ncbi:nitroreductase family protein [Williamsia sterculiae]|uniref:Nitroreductase n=1 Tax=Williamsia sterculiae TaxID=1344003 RepID=A0A1N7F604_9NOCA|nr:nitroreductase family protein [Williamsia sterculiae]SIR95739.1 Nitroreductase [Williamsia sterculiae]
MHELIAARRSARGYDATAEITDDQLDAILEAGRWAPTWGAEQPVRFIVGRRGDTTFDGLVATMRRGNLRWAPASAALVLICTRTLPDEHRADTYAAVDVGLATAQMILQAVAEGFNGHPMAGFTPQQAVETFAIPVSERPLVLLAIGRLADPATVDPEVAERDDRERTRLPLREVAFADRWGTPYR